MYFFVSLAMFVFLTHTLLQLGRKKSEQMVITLIDITLGRD